MRPRARGEPAPAATPTTSTCSCRTSPTAPRPLEEILAGFDDLVQAGKILHGGLSNFPAWRVAGAAVRAELRGLAPLVGIETEYSLAQRTAERELLPMVEAHGLGALLYSPLAGGLLTGKYRRGDKDGSPAAASGTETAQQTRRGRRCARRSPTRPAPVPPRSRWPGYATAPHWPNRAGHDRRTTDTGPARGVPARPGPAPRRRPVRPAGRGQRAPLGVPHDDVAAALAHGFDGDRAQLRTSSVPVT